MMRTYQTHPTVARGFEQYVGLSFKQYNCAQLAAKVLREQFGNSYAASYLEHFAGVEPLKITQLQAGIARYIDTPEHGCCVILSTYSQQHHLGLYLEMSVRSYILHTHRSGSTLATLDRLAPYTIEGYYQWDN